MPTKRHWKRKAVSKFEVLIGALVLVTLGWLLVPSIHEKSVIAQREACLANLGAMARGLSAYLKDNGDRWPFVAKLASVKLHDPPWPTLPEVLGPYVNRREVFRCPADRRILADDSPLRERFATKTTWYETEGMSYEWLWGELYGGKKIGDESLAQAKGFGFGRADQPLIGEFEPFHAGGDGGSFNTLNADLKPRTARDRPAVR